MQTAGLILALAAQAAPDPLAAVVPPSQAEMMACVPAAQRRARSVGDMPAGPRRAVIGCWQRLIARNINARLPIEIHAGMTLVRAEAVELAIRYHYRAEADAARVTDAERAGLTEAVRSKVCDPGGTSRRILSLGATFHYLWRDREDQPLHEAVIDRC